MNKTSEPKKETAIDNYQDFNEAILEIHRNIEEIDSPFLEVTPKFFSALAKGRPLLSMTYGDPGVRIYQAGTKEKIDAEERLSAEAYRELELKRANGRA